MGWRAEERRDAAVEVVLALSAAVTGAAMAAALRLPEPLDDMAGRANEK